MHVGDNTSGSRFKSVYIPSGLGCPHLVNINNWWGNDDYPDNFIITISGNTLTAERIDENKDWGMDLHFYCWTTASPTKSRKYIIFIIGFAFLLLDDGFFN